jgi:dTDP-4-amino-4,6-dideoxygalactose transaminase
MMISINKPQFDDEEKNVVIKVLEEGPLTSAAHEGGPRVQDFEKKLAEYLNVKHVVAVNSGTSALHSALLASGIGSGDEVILPSFTFVATANAVAATGARPVFVDISEENYNIDMSAIEKCITSKTKALIPVHLYGYPAPMNEIIELANKHSISIIEDACQSIGSSYYGKQTGSIGDIGCFSLYASKVLTCGEGGAVTTNNDELAFKTQIIRNHGMVKGYDTQALGLNMRLPEISAALANSQMKKLSHILEVRKRNANIFDEELRKIHLPDLSLPHESNHTKNNWYLYTVALNKNRDRVKNQLNEKGIGASIYYDPAVHMTPFYLKSFPSHDLENTESASKKVLSLPVHQSLTPDDIEFICNSLKKVLA